MKLPKRFPLTITMGALKIKKEYEERTIRQEIENKIKGYLKYFALNNKEDKVNYGYVGHLIYAVEGVVEYEELAINGAKDSIDLTMIEIPVFEKLNIDALEKV